jgi:predicted nucleic acid-binding protein
MRGVLDTNVFISGIFFSGPPSRILKAWEDRRFQIVLSQDILIEYQRVAEDLSRKFPTVDIVPIIELGPRKMPKYLDRARIWIGFGCND